MLQCDGGDPTVTDEPPTTTDEPSVTTGDPVTTDEPSVTDAPDNTTQNPPPGGDCDCPGGGTPGLSMEDGYVQMKCEDKVLCQGSCHRDGNSNTNNAKVKFIFSNLHLINCIF